MFQKCNKCEFEVGKTLSCGHQVIAPCSMDPSKIKCTEKIARKNLKCGHELEMACSESVVKFEKDTHCVHPCETLLDCGHMCQGTCATCHQGKPTRNTFSRS